MPMTAPTDTLVSFQRALRAGVVPLQPGEIDQTLYVHRDHPNGRPRFIYMKIDGKTITALAIFAMLDPRDGVVCLQTGYAVPESYRGQGRAKDILRSAVAELKNGLSRAGVKSFLVEAVIGIDNLASQKVAVAVISGTPKTITDEFSGLPALQYVLKVTA